MGHEPRLSTKLNSVEIFVEKMKRLRTEAEEALNKAAADMKRFYDEKHQFILLEIRSGLRPHTLTQEEP